MSTAKKKLTSCQQKPAVIYARYSSHNQTEQSIEGQMHDAYEYAEKNGFTIIDEYIDRAKTATSDDRPAFQQMIKDSAKGLFQFVIVWKQDRFARNRYDSAVYKRLLKNNSVRVVSVMENISDSPEGVILEGLLESMAEYYSANLSENIKRGKAESVRKGLYPGGPVPIGYTIQDKHLIPDPRTAHVVQEIFRRYADGERTADIVRDLNARGLRAKRGALFQRATLMHILENRTYTGDYYYGDQIITESITPLIDHDLFDRADARRAAARKAPGASRDQSSPCLLTGKIFCGECGGKILGACGKNKAGKVYKYYQCEAQAHKRSQCGIHHILREDIHYGVCRVVSDFVLNKKRRTLEALADSIMALYQSEIDTSALKSIESQYNQLERDLDKLVDSLIMMPESARPRIAQRMEALEQQKNDLGARLIRKRAECSAVFSKDDFVKALRITFDDLKNIENQKFIMNNFVNSVYIYKDGRMVVYLNSISGLPHPLEDDLPGKDAWKNGKSLPVPAGAFTLKDFSSCSSLYTYAPVNVCKQEHSPLFFFLHGRIGVVLWRYPLKEKEPLK